MSNGIFVQPAGLSAFAHILSTERHVRILRPKIVSPILSHRVNPFGQLNQDGIAIDDLNHLDDMLSQLARTNIAKPHSWPAFGFPFRTGLVATGADWNGNPAHQINQPTSLTGVGRIQAF